MTDHSGIRKRLADAAEDYFKALERDAYYPAGCSGYELADHLIQALPIKEGYDPARDCLVIIIGGAGVDRG